MTVLGLLKGKRPGVVKSASLLAFPWALNPKLVSDRSLKPKGPAHAKPFLARALSVVKHVVEPCHQVRPFDGKVTSEIEVTFFEISFETRASISNIPQTLEFKHAQ